MFDLKNLAQRPLFLIVGVAGGLLVVALLVYFGFSGESTPTNEAPKAYFTVDDGQTWFQDDFTRIAPFDHNGKTAYRCYLFTRDGGKTRVVGYLEKQTDEARALLESLKKENREPTPIDQRTFMTAVEVKRPGDKVWISRSDPRAREITMPSGSNGELIPVE